MVEVNAAGFPFYTIVGTPDGGQEATISINSNDPDAFGSYWWLDGDVQGWDSPDMRVTMLTKIGSDVDAEGEVPADLHYRGRSLVLKLYCEANSEINRQNSRLLLAQAANTSACTFTAVEEVPKLMSVVRSGNNNQGKLTILEHGYPGKAASSTDPSLYPDGWGFPPGTTTYLFEATVELYAQDPFKYSTSAVVTDFDESGFIAIDNVGTYPSMKAVIELSATGGGNGPIFLATPERSLRLGVPTLPAGAPALNPIPEDLFVNLYEKLIIDSGGGSYYYLRDMQTPWLRIPTGSTNLGVDPPQAGSLRYQAAWL